jgi:hypothetical protein
VPSGEEVERPPIDPDNPPDNQRGPPIPDWIRDLGPTIPTPDAVLVFGPRLVDRCTYHVQLLVSVLQSLCVEIRVFIQGIPLRCGSEMLTLTVCPDRPQDQAQGGGFEAEASSTSDGIHVTVTTGGNVVLDTTIR